MNCDSLLHAKADTKTVVLEVFYKDIAKTIATDFFHPKSTHLHLNIKQKEQVFLVNFTKKSLKHNSLEDRSMVALQLQDPLGQKTFAKYLTIVLPRERDILSRCFQDV